MGFRFLKRINANTGLFAGHFIDVKTFYVLRFNTIPCISFIGDMDLAKVFTFMTETYNADIAAAYQHSYFNHDEKTMYFNNTIIVMQNKRMVELTDNYCHVLHTPGDYEFARQLFNNLSQFRTENDIRTAFRHTHVVGFAKEAEMN